jgi:hypothetical protein
MPRGRGIDEMKLIQLERQKKRPYIKVQSKNPMLGACLGSPSITAIEQTLCGPRAKGR